MEGPGGWIECTLEYNIQFFFNFLIITCGEVDKNVKKFLLPINLMYLEKLKFWHSINFKEYRERHVKKPNFGAFLFIFSKNFALAALGLIFYQYIEK